MGGRTRMRINVIVWFNGLRRRLKEEETSGKHTSATRISTAATSLVIFDIRFTIDLNRIQKCHHFSTLYVYLVSSRLGEDDSRTVYCVYSLGHAL